ncbi:MAG: class I SAM-dependent methyltransferase [Candidatus Pacearchaeota archaeon]
MKISNQKQVWNNIAEEWHEFKIEKKGKHTLDFLKGKKGKILDLGSGSGRYLTKIIKGKMYLVDFSEKMINLAKSKAKKEKIDAEFVVADMTKLPFEDNFFDYAIASSSFHCIPKKDQLKSTKELFRVLKPNAQAEISVWNKQSKRFKNAPKEKFVGWRDKGKRYYYLFEEDEIYNLFKKAGFKTISKQESGIMIVFVVEK